MNTQHLHPSQLHHPDFDKYLSSHFRNVPKNKDQYLQKWVDEYPLLKPERVRLNLVKFLVHLIEDKQHIEMKPTLRYYLHILCDDKLLTDKMFSHLIPYLHNIYQWKCPECYWISFSSVINTKVTDELMSKVEKSNLEKFLS